MKVEPPTGDALAELLTEVKGRVLDAAEQTPPQRKKLSLTWFIMIGVAALVIGGTGTAVATGVASGVFHPIPHTTHRASDPTPPAFKQGNNNNPITPEQASLDQLWASAKSDLDPSGPSNSTGIGSGMTDFANAIALRCYPRLSSADAAQLETLRTAYQSATGSAALGPARVYVDRATELCM
jgi:hypothetical protein